MALLAVLGASIVAVAAATVASADTAPSSGVPATVSADALPTVQVNGVVWAQTLVGSTVYATGDFTETWPAGQSSSSTNQTARSNLLAYNITTGQLTPFDHTLNAQGLDLTASPDGKTLYVVGDFTTVDGQSRPHIAAFDVSSGGALLSNFAPNMTGTTRAVVATANAVYVGGSFAAVGSMARGSLAAFSPANGALLSWAPQATGSNSTQVDAMTLTPDRSRVIVGGRFAQLNGQTVYGLGSVDAQTGASEPFAINSVVRGGDGSGHCGITSLSTGSNAIYGTAFNYTGCKSGNFEGRFAADPTSGKPIWINDCHGDSYGTAPVGGVLYSVGHAHDCRAIGSFPDASAPGGNQRALAETTAASGGTDTGPDSYGWNFSGQPDASILDWFPKLTPGTFTNQDQAAWSVVGNSSYIALAGEFPSVNGQAQSGLVRFAVRSVAPNTLGPIPTSTLTPSVKSNSSGTATLSWKATWDQDNQNLTYDVLRDNGTTPIATLHQASTFWQLPTMSFTDTGLTPGSSHTYRLRITDPIGNHIGSSTSAAVTIR